MKREASIDRLGLEAASLDIRGTTPRSAVYDDVYFSADDGLAESRHVFIDGNDLERRFADWRPGRAFVIGETGFGTGRNVLVAWQVFERVAPANARLHIVSIERHPLDSADLTALWPAGAPLAAHAARLIQRWPARVRGTHRLRLAERVTLDLVFDDIEAALAGFEPRVDAWFLDGFAPRRNPAMWNAAVFNGLAAASRPGASFATYSCARIVREHADAAGFAWARRAGAGRKRDMLHGHLRGARRQGDVAPARCHTPWFEPPACGGAPIEAPVAVIGAGIAGAAVVEALARRGVACAVYDADGVAAGASGNAQAALHVRLAAAADARTRFQLAAFGYTRRWLAEIDPGRRLWADDGLLHLALDDRQAARQQRCLDRLGLPATLVHRVDAARASALAGLSLAPTVAGGLFFPGGGWVRPEALCRQLFERSGVAVRRTTVTRLARRADCWRLETQDGHSAAYAHVILACGPDAARLVSELPPMSAVRGQVSLFTVPGDIPTPARVVCGRGYVLPLFADRLLAGASFQRDVSHAVPRLDEDGANRDKIAEFAPGLAAALAAPVASRVAFRCTGHDRLPYVGPVPDAAAWRRDYAALALDARRIAPLPGACRPGLWASLAHGAHGMVSAPLAAEMLASRLCDEPMPGAVADVDALHPGRWLVRELIRGR